MHQHAEESERDVQNVSEQRNDDQEDQSDYKQILRKSIADHRSHLVEVVRNVGSGETDREQADVREHIHETSDQGEWQVQRGFKGDGGHDQHHADSVHPVCE